MNNRITEQRELLAATVIKGLESRNMKGYYARNKEEALKTALELIPEGSTVAMGGCESAVEIGLVDALSEGNYSFNREHSDKEDMLYAYSSDFFISSANAMTADGVLINIDGNANRVSCIAQGPDKVLLLVGMNKICPDADSAMKRARNIAAPINALRVGSTAPCTHTGQCMDCKSPSTICCQFLITRFSRHPGRIHVILVNENLGF